MNFNFTDLDEELLMAFLCYHVIQRVPYMPLNKPFELSELVDPALWILLNIYQKHRFGARVAQLSRDGEIPIRLLERRTKNKHAIYMRRTEVTNEVA